MDNRLQMVQQHLAHQFQFDLAQLQPDLQLDQLGLDSLAIIECMLSIENEFKVRMPNGRLEVKTVRDMVSLIERMLQQQGNA